MSKHSNIWAYEGRPYSNHYSNYGVAIGLQVIRPMSNRALELYKGRSADSACSQGKWGSGEEGAAVGSLGSIPFRLFSQHRFLRELE